MTNSIYKLLGAILVIVLVSACDNELQLVPESSVTVDVFFQTEDDIEQAVVAAYASLQDEGQYGFNFMFMMEIRADDAFVESPTNSNGAQGDIDLFQISSDNFRIRDAWNSIYRGIQRCNAVLNRIDDVNMDNAIRDIRKGEVQFLRALHYFNLVRLWGDVPLVLEETSDPFDLFSVGSSPQSVVYQQIIRDLNEASDDLPIIADEIGRATQGAALTLLGKVHLTLGNWGEAVSALRQVSGYELQPVFADNFGIVNENGIESIFEVQFQAGNGEGSLYPNQVAPVGSGAELLNGIGNQRGENIPARELFEAYEEGDLRRDASIGVLASGTGLYAKKLIDIPAADNDSDLNFIVMRYADVVLMLAEALNEQGYSANGEAFDLLNQIRNRAGLASLTAANLPDQSSFREAVYRERRQEFASENQRWFDLLRTGRALEVLNEGNLPFSVSEFQLLFPIPLTAIDAINDPALFPQNPGY